MKTLNDQQRRAMIVFGGKAQSHMAVSEMGELIGRVAQMHHDIETTENIAPETAQELAKETYDHLFTLPQLFAYIESYVPNFWQMVEDAGEVEKCRMEQRLQDAERKEGVVMSELEVIKKCNLTQKEWDGLTDEGKKRLTYLNTDRDIVIVDSPSMGEFLVNRFCQEHGLSEDQTSVLCAEIKNLANKAKCDKDSIFMIVADSISGGVAMNKAQVVHQIKVALNNSGIKKFF